MEGPFLGSWFRPQVGGSFFPLSVALSLLPRDPQEDLFCFGGIFGEMADNGWTNLFRSVFPVVLRCFEGFGGENKREKGKLSRMEGFGWRKRESGKKLRVMSGYEWCEGEEGRSASERMRLER